MRNIFILLALFAAYSCQPEQNVDDRIVELTVERDSLKTEYKKIGKKLRAVEAELLELDTNKKLINITAREISTQPFEHFFQVYGSVNSENNSQLAPEASGTIIRIYVSDGEDVKKGQVLLELDDDIIEKNIAEVKTQRQLAEDVYNKQKALWDKNIGSEIQYLEAKNNLESLDTRLASLEAQRSKTRLRAPYSGVVDEVFVKAGEMANPGMPALRLVNVDNVYLKADISERYLEKVKVGTPVIVEMPSLNESIKSEVIQTGYFINSANRTFSVRIALPKTNEKMLPNLLGLVKIKDYHADSAIVIPTKLLQENAQGESFIYILEKDENGLNIAKLRTVTPGMSYMGKTEILAGLAPGEVIIEAGARSVSNEQRVEWIKG